MYVISNAFKNLGRNKGRNIFIAVILFAIILTTAVSIIINTTSGEIIDDYTQRFGAEATLKLDYTKVYQRGNGYKTPTIPMMLDFADSEYLMNYEFDASLRIYSDSFEAVGTPISMGGDLSITGGTSSEGTGGSDVEEKMMAAKGTVYAPSRADISDDFKNGTRSIVEGEIFTKPDECIISDYLANKNNWAIGDTISFYGTNDSEKSDEINLIIVGIYMDFSYIKDDELYGTIFNRANDIFVNSEALLGMDSFEENGNISAKYYLKSPEMLEVFEKELREKGLDDCYDVSTDITSYETIVAPVKGLSKVTGTFLIVVLILGTSVLIFLSTLAIRERKYEIGVLRAMGMKKAIVVLGITCEMLMLTIISLVLGLGIGFFASQPVADILLAEQVNATANHMHGIPIVYGQESAKGLSEITISLSFFSIAQITIIAIVLALISSIAGIVYITKYEPMQILMERN